MALHRAIKDATFVKSKALPAAGASNNTSTFDLGAGGFVPEGIEVEISIPALAAHTDTSKNVTLTVQDSADDNSYTSLSAPAITVTRPGIASTGTDAEVIKFRLPAGVRRYVQINQAVTSGGPTLTASSITYSLLF